MNAGRVAGAARHPLRWALRRALEEPRRSTERNPDERPQLDTLDDWILFGPRMH